MVSPATVRQWRLRLRWPTVLATIYVAMYASVRLLGAFVGGPEAAVPTWTHFVSPEHLATPLGAVFGVSLVVILGYLGLRVYMGVRNY